MPSGPGLWPAFWMMGQGAPWPACGELDIMEAVGDCAAVCQTAHGPDRGDPLTRRAAQHELRVERPGNG